MITPIGYFAIWRELYTKPIWTKSTPQQKVVLLTLLAMANFKENEWEWSGEKFKVDKGQFVTSLESIRLAAGKDISIQNVRSSLKRFEKLEFLTNKSTKQGRLITILNWRLYQPQDGEPNKANDKDPTKTQQSTNKDPTPIEEGNKDKKETREEKEEDIVLPEEPKKLKTQDTEEYKGFVSWFMNTFKGKKQKPVRDRKAPKVFEKVGDEHLRRATERYMEECNRLDRYIMNEGTWWNGRYEEYLDKNFEYVETPKNNGKSKTARELRENKNMPEGYETE